jgi:DNA-binding NarL/FixJ family response regulator
MAKGEPIRVFLVDDHEVVREGLKRMLASSVGIEIVGAVATGEEAVAWVRRVNADVVLLDLSLPRMQGLEVLSEMRGLDCPPRVVVLTVHDDLDLVVGAARRGASGYVLKQTSRDELTKAIRIAAAGGQYFCTELVRLLAFGSQTKSSAVPLGERETQVLRLLASGGDNKEIADLLHVSNETVKTHLANIYRKLGAEGRAHAVALALRQRLLD